MTIVEFLLARIADDEAAASAKPPGAFIERHTMYYRASEADGFGYVWTSRDRVLAECAAKRQIVELHKFGPGYRQRQPWEHEWPQPEYVRDVCGECYEWDEDDDCASNAAAPCATIRTMAQVYSDHPDYRQEWAR